jgi:hypothetical protein
LLSEFGFNDGRFFPPFRYGNIIGTMVATNESQTCWLPLRVLLSRLFEILSSKKLLRNAAARSDMPTILFVA